jgi:signal transduction histidine kinase
VAIGAARGTGDMTPPEPVDDGTRISGPDAGASSSRPALIVQCRADGVLTFANDAYCHTVSRSREELTGQSFWSFLPPHERQRGRRHVKSLTPAEPAAIIEYLLDSPPGVPRRQRWTDHARFDEAGRLIEWLALGEDVPAKTPDWLTEATLQASILAALPDLFVLFSTRGEYLEYRAPPGAPHPPPNGLVGRNIHDVLPRAVADRFQAAFDGTLATGEISTLQYTMDEAGEERALEARIVKCTPHVLLALIRDRTEERQTTQALQRAELEARDLQQEIALLGQVASLGVLAGSIAHELNQPLMSTATNTQAALKFLGAPEPNIEEARAALADIGRSNRRLSEMTRHLLAKLKTQAVAHLPLDLNAVAADVIRLVSRQPRARGIAIEPQLAAGLPQVPGDRIQLQQVVLNLLLNACDAAGEKGAVARRVVVRTESQAETVSLSVIDSGVGIPPEDVSRVFEPFYTTKSHGTGLGLAISRTILTLHGGRLRALPNPDGGMMFTFALNRAPADHGNTVSNVV